MVFTASLVDAQHNRDCVENKPASLLVVSLCKPLNKIPHLHVADSGGAKQSTRRGGLSLTEDSQTEPERTSSVHTVHLPA